MMSGCNGRNVEILEPREGIGGHCLPKDTRMFMKSMFIRSKILAAAMEVDEDYKRYRDNTKQASRNKAIPTENVSHESTLHPN